MCKTLLVFFWTQCIYAVSSKGTYSILDVTLESLDASFQLHHFSFWHSFALLSYDRIQYADIYLSVIVMLVVKN